MDGSLIPLKITGFKDEGYEEKASVEPYSLMINPEKISWNKEVSYNEEQAPATAAPSQKYKNTPKSDLSFDIIIDCTGIVDSSRKDMATEIKKLEDVIYTYNGEIHRPNFVIVQWGKNLLFKSVLKKIDTTYTLFKPDGSPIRAEISLGFGGYADAKTVAQQEKKESPDMTHLVDVKDGDTLPGLSNRIWGDSSHYIHVARFNKLPKFRRLIANQQLVFPPLEAEEV